MELPTGTVTFLFSDIEGSTRLWETEPDAMRPALEQHDELSRTSIESAAGVVVKTMGDGFLAVFAEPTAALDAAVMMQRACVEADWRTSMPLRIRVGVHTGDAQLRDADYFGPTLNRAARLMAAGHGGQIVCSATTGELVRDQLGEGVRLVDLGEHRLRDLARTERVFQITHPALPRDFPDLRTIDTLPGNLPVQPNRFVGRDELVADIGELLVDSRVATITGPGGVGKTRLALQVAAAVQPDYEDGAWFVDLAPVTDPDLVASVLLETLDFVLAEGEDEVAGLCSRLRRRNILLILDNCERVTAGVSRVADAISRAADGVRMIATSREGLGIAAEQIVPIPPLGTGPDGEAIRLFVTRARATRPNFELNDGNREAVIELCTRLDGIPLAIELAAARTRSVSPSQILERLDQRFRLLRGADRTTTARHQTLQAAIDWSYELLTVEEQIVLHRLSIFVGGFTLDAAEQILCDDTIDEYEVLGHLGALVDKSLVVADDTALGHRYRLLETIREYASERLDEHGEKEELRSRHATHYLAHAHAAASDLQERDEVAALDRLDADLDNIRAMLGWHVEHDQAGAAAVVVDELNIFLQIRDHPVWGITHLDACLESSLDDSSRSVALAARAWHKANTAYAGAADDAAAAHAAAERAGIEVPLAAIFAEATVAITGDPVLAYERADHVAEVAHVRGDSFWFVQGRSAGLMFRCLAHVDAAELLERVAVLRQEFDPWWDRLEVRQQYLLAAVLANMLVDPPQALRLLDQKLRVASELGSRFGVADAHFFMGIIRLGMGDVPAAAQSCHRALVGHHDAGMRRGVFMTLSGVAGIANQTGHTETAAMILAGLRRAREDYSSPGSSTEQFAEERLAQRLARDVGDTALVDEPAAGLEETVDAALDFLVAVQRMPA